MTLQIVEAVEADLPTLLDIQLAAFQPLPIQQLMYRGGYTPSSTAASLERMRSDFRTAGATFLKVVDPTLAPAEAPDSIIAFAKWEIQPQLRPRAEWDKEYPMPADLGAGVDRAVMVAFLQGIRARRAAAIKGKPHMGLNMLATRPGQERRGAGALLVRWGMERAVKEGLDCYLEATPPGLPLYKRLGFEDFDEWDFDAREYGGEGLWRTWYLWRPVDARSRERGAFAKDDEGE